MTQVPMPPTTVRAPAPASGPRGPMARVMATLALAVATLAMVILPSGAARAAVGEAMERFDAVYDLQADGSVQVTENITWRFPEGEQRHGIFRSIVVRMGYQDQDNTYRYFGLHDVSVESPTGAPSAFRVSDFGSSKQIRIGDANQWTSGTQKYVVRYTLDNVLNAIGANGSAASDPADAKTVEFHYNVFSASETTARENVTVTVNSPAAAQQVVCYRGVFQSDEKCQSSTAGDAATFSATDLSSGEALTVIAGYPASAFGTIRPDIRSGSSGSTVGSAAAPAVNTAAIAAGVAAPLVAAAAMGTLVWKRGRDERYADVTPGLQPSRELGESQAVTRGGRPTVAVQFTPPEGVTPGLVGVVIDEKANPIDVSATLLDLAVRGYLRIEETQGGLMGRTDWTLYQQHPPEGDVLLPYERQLLVGIFGSRGPVVTLSELKNHFATTLASVQASMYAETVERNWFRSSPEMQRRVWQSLGGVIAFLGVILFIFGRAAIETMLGASLPGLMVAAGGLVLAGLITVLLGGRMAAKTAVGSAVHQQSLGFKEYLVTAEADQIAFDEAANIFSRYLPYAVVFGVADRWAKVFADVARAAEAAGHTILMPTWYIGPGGYTDFGSIANGADSFGTTSTGTFTSTPGSSGSSGFSGGGGFSGSGGGGSSSGSW